MTRIVQLGAPNAGSYAPVQALRAVYPTVRKMAALDRAHSAEELARRVFLGLPGLCQMLPSQLSAARSPTCSTCAAGRTTTWCRCRDARARPPDPRETACRRRAMLRLVGVEQDTIVPRAARLRFRYTIRTGGDGTVPLERALWPDAATWFVTRTHGALTNNNAVLADGRSPARRRRAGCARAPATPRRRPGM